MPPSFFSDSDLADFRALNEDNLIHRARVLVPTRTKQPGGVIALTYPDWRFVDPVPCRLGRPTSDEMERLRADKQEARPITRVTFAVDEPIDPSAQLYVEGETADEPWAHRFEIVGVALRRTYESQRRVLAALVLDTATTPQQVAALYDAGILYDSGAVYG